MLLLHQWNCCKQAIIHTFDIHTHNTVEIPGTGGIGLSNMRYARTVHQNINPANLVIYLHNCTDWLVTSQV